MPDDLTEDGFLGERLRLLQPRKGFRSGIDAVLLAASVEAREGEAVLELGCGAGVALCCLGARVPGLRLYGLELQPGYAALARENAARSGLSADVFEGDLRRMPAELKALNFDHVIANPPYYRQGHWTPAGREDRARALGEEAALEEWLDAAARRLRPGGRISFIQKAARFPDLLTSLGPRFGAIELKPIAPRENRAAELVILRARKGARAAPHLCAPLILHEGKQHTDDRPDWTEAAVALLRDGAGLVC